MKTEELKQEIERAFSGVAYPGDSKIAPHDHCAECEKLADDLRGQHWRDVIKLMPSALSGQQLPLLIGEAFNFYFPAFLQASLEPELRPFVFDAVVFMINNGKLVDLTSEQKKAALAVVKAVHHPQGDLSGDEARAIKILTEDIAKGGAA